MSGGSDPVSVHGRRGRVRAPVAATRRRSVVAARHPATTRRTGGGLPRRVPERAGRAVASRRGRPGGMRPDGAALRTQDGLQDPDAGHGTSSGD